MTNVSQVANASQAIAVNTPERLSAARWAVSATFFANGYTVGNWAPKIPFMVERLGITEITLGRMIILFGVGAIIALITAAATVAKYGSKRIVRLTSVMLIPSLLLITVTDTVWTTALAMLWLGMFLGAMDNAMNANGVGVEVELGRPVMSSYHGFWSLGGVAGGLTGGALIVWLGELGHAILIAVLTAALVFWAWPRLLDDPASSHDDGNGNTRKAGFLSGLPRNPGIYLLGIITMLSFASEGTVVDWSALYLKDELSSPLIVSGYAFAAFSFTMAIVRLTGDRLRTRFGDRQMFIGSGVIAATGLLVAGLATDFVTACGGFLLSGFGMANLVPVLFSTAGKFPGIKPSISIAIITTFGYAGLLFIPALVGEVAHIWSLSHVFIAWAVIVYGVTVSGFVLPGIGGKKPG